MKLKVICHERVYVAFHQIKYMFVEYNDVFHEQIVLYSYHILAGFRMTPTKTMAVTVALYLFSSMCVRGEFGPKSVLMSVFKDQHLCF